MRTLALLLGIGSVAGAFAQPFGPDVIDRPSVDRAYQITFISGHAAPTSGEISEWRLWADTPDVVTLQMWRPISGGYQLVGFNTVTVTQAGYNVIPIATNRIQVLAGDVIGFRYNQTILANRVIDCTFSVGGLYQWTNWPDPTTNVPVGGSLLNSQLVGLWEGREYSLAATVVPEPVSLIGLSIGALALLRRRAR